MNNPQPATPIKPHRGVLVAVLGLLGTPLWIFGAISWVLGNRDLKAMAEGKMDASGRALTRAGKILGILGLALNLLWIAKRIFVDGVGNLGPAPGP